MTRKGAFLTAVSVLRRRPWVLALSIAAVAAMYPCFFSVVSFTSALSPEEAIEKWNKPLPPGWTAAVMNHGQYYRWWPIHERPVLFSVSLAGLIVSVGWLWGVLLWVWIQHRKGHVEACRTGK